MLKELMLFSSAGSIFQPGELVFIDGGGFREFYKVISWGEYAQGVRSSYHERRQRKKAEKGQLVCLRYVSSSIPFTGGSTARIIRVSEILQRTTLEEAETYVRQKFQENLSFIKYLTLFIILFFHKTFPSCQDRDGYCPFRLQNSIG